MATSNKDNFSATIFAPGGRLMQIESAKNASRLCSTAVGVRGANCVVLGIERRVADELQIDRVVRKIHNIDDNIAIAYAGLTGDGRIIIERATVECQSHRLIVEAPISVFDIARYISDLKHKYTITFGLRPFGVMCLIGGFDADGSPRLYQTKPSGNFSEWRANAIGRCGQTILQYFENVYNINVAYNVHEAIKMALKALLLVTKLEQNNIEVSVLEYNKPIKRLSHRELMYYAKEIGN